jgi:segregation and condensation protein B
VNDDQLQHQNALIEALLFAAREPVTVDRLAQVAGLPEQQVRQRLTALATEYRERRAGIELVEVAGGYQLRTRKVFAHYIEQLLAPQTRELSNAALEVIAIVACKQPLTRAEIDAVRGVNSDSALKTLVEYGLVEELGRKEAPGRPFLYGTTEGFLEEFGLKTVDELVAKLETEEQPEKQLELFAKPERAVEAAARQDN